MALEIKTVFTCSAPSKIFVSRLVPKKCRQDQKKLRRPYVNFLKMRPFLLKNASSTIFDE